ncbi:MAG: peptide chain release factor 2 [Opitutales bacterium]|nr:peptide chain release factor 2 [Opitutales bacterium]
MQNPELRNTVDTIVRRAAQLRRFLDIEGKRREVEALEARMAESGFWDRPDAAREVVSEAARLKGIITPAEDLRRRVDDMRTLIELMDESESEDALEFEREIETSAPKLLGDLDELEIRSFLSAPMDKNNAIVSIHSGAGGTEACDWADMLLRMYMRWAERRGFTVEVEDIAPGEEAGISRATLRIIGEYAFGNIKSERGVHRLVRISPFDSNKRRHTTFGAVDVVAEVDDDIDVEVREEDLKIDTYRSSGAGGQHVNKTESAIRITHIPSGIIVACQNERSQHKNKATALKMLKSKIYEKAQDAKRAEIERFYSEKGDIGWGYQIRSYVFQPYQMVKDLRTGAESGNIQAVMDGDIDQFIQAWLRAGCPKNRNKNIQLDD